MRGGFTHGFEETHCISPWFWGSSWFLIHGFGGVPHPYKDALSSLYFGLEINGIKSLLILASV
jgi:hypothetical protein